MATNHFRRSTDLGEVNLDALIADENDPGKRTLLLLLSALNANIIANTKTTEVVSTDLASLGSSFSVHAANEEALMNKGKGAWKVLAVVLGLAQVLISFGMVALMNKVAAIDNNIIMLQMANVKQEAQNGLTQSLIEKK